MPDKAGIDELLAKGSTSRVLFTLDGKAYGGKAVSYTHLFCCDVGLRQVPA